MNTMSSDKIDPLSFKQPRKIWGTQSGEWTRKINTNEENKQTYAYMQFGIV